jgi:hypothetical protein
LPHFLKKLSGTLAFSCDKSLDNAPYVEADLDGDVFRGTGTAVYRFSSETENLLFCIQEKAPLAGCLFHFRRDKPAGLANRR